MAGILLERNRRLPRPPASFEVDQAHPLARDLVLFVPMWIGGPRPNGPLYGHGTLDTVSTFGPQGVTVGVSGGANVGYKADVPPATGAAMPQASFAVYANITGQAGDFAGLFMARNSGGVGMHSRSTGPSLSLNWNSADTTYNTLIQAYDLNRWQVLGVSARVGVMTGASGKGITSTATNAPTAQSAAFTALDWRVGMDTFATTRTVQGTYAWAAMWRRYLNPDEWAWLQAEPFALVRPKVARARYFAVANPIASMSAAVSDTAAGSSDSVTRKLASARAVSDLTSASDTAVRSALASARALTDSAPGSDAVTRLLTMARGLSASVAGSDTAARTIAESRSVGDTAPGTDMVARMLAAARTVTDPAAGSDVVSRALANLRAVTDTATVTDGADRAFGAGRAVSDPAGAADDVGRTLGYTRNPTDSAPGTDGLALLAGYVRGNSDSVAGASTVSRLLTMARVAADTAPAVSVTSRAATLVRAVTDAAASSDVVSAVFHAFAVHVGKIRAAVTSHSQIRATVISLSRIRSSVSSRGVIRGGDRRP